MPQTHLTVPRNPQHVKTENPKGDHLSRAVQMSGMSQFMHSDYQTRQCGVPRDQGMSADQSEQGCPYNVHTQLCSSWGCTLAVGARPHCGSDCK